MTAVFPIKDNNCLFEILKYNQDTLDLVRMRAVCRRWRTIVDHVSRNMLLSLGARVEHLDEATVRIFQITFCFKQIMHPNSHVNNINKIREMIPKLERITQLKLIEQTFETAQRTFDLKEYDLFLRTVSTSVPNGIGKSSFMTILLNLSKNLALAAKYNSQEGFLHILNHYSPGKKDLQEALLPACGAGNFTLIHTLIDLEADPLTDNAETDEIRDTFLTAACKSNCFKGVKLLMERGVNIEVSNSLGEKPIAIAARVNEKMFDLFKDKVKDPKEKFGPQHDKTLAHYAAEGNKPEVIHWLISKEIAIDEQNNRGLTPLMIAIREQSTETFYALLECGASLEKRCASQYSPLDYAVLRGNEVFLEILIERNTQTGILYGALKTAIAQRKTFAVNRLSKALGVSTPVKYGLAIIGGAVIGGLLVKKYFEGNGE